MKERLGSDTTLKLKTCKIKITTLTKEKTLVFGRT